MGLNRSSCQLLMSGQFFEYNGTTLHFSKSGIGPKVLLAFHGFGQDYRAFEILTRSLHDHCTIFCFDIFFHGKSAWNKREVALEKSFWKILLTEFLRLNRIERFNLLGFSMGGKFVLASLEIFPEKIDHVFLLAPDGIKTNLWYNLATYPTILRGLFKSMISKPNRFKNIANLAFKAGIIDKGVLRFVEFQMNTEQKRNQVYYSWVVFRHLKFNMNDVASIINLNKINLTIVVGKHDQIITPMNMNRLLKRLKNYQLEIAKAGHTGIIAASAKLITEAFKGID